jgi:hypothetical protein
MSFDENFPKIELNYHWSRPTIGPTRAKMKKSILRFCFVVIFAATVFAQQATVANTVPSKDDVMQFLELMKIRDRMVQMVEGMKKGMKAGAEAGFKTKLPSATPEQLARFDLVTETVFKDFPIDEMIDAMVPIYQKHLTKGDLDAVIAFYSSAVGQKLLKEQPAMMAEGMQVGQDIMLRKLPDMQERLKTKVAELADEEVQKSRRDRKRSP